MNDRTAVLEGVRLADRPEPAATEDTAVVAVSVAGICNTNLELVRGYMGFRGILGHEFVGRVVEGPPAWLGKRVVGEINFVSLLPKTRSGKIMRRVLKAVVLDRDPGDITTIEDEGSVEEARLAWATLRQDINLK